MMYIKTLSKIERKELKERFLASKECSIYNKAQRVFILSLLGVVYALAVTPYDIYNNSGIWNYILDGLLFAFSLIFLIRMVIFKNNEFNKFALKEKSNKNK